MLWGRKHQIEMIVSVFAKINVTAPQLLRSHQHRLCQCANRARHFNLVGHCCCNNVAGEQKVRPSLHVGVEKEHADV